MPRPISKMPPFGINQFARPMHPRGWAAICWLMVCSWNQIAAQSTTVFPLPLKTVHIHNTFRAATNIYSGSSPDSDAAFQELASLGVKAVVSVDGGKPDLASAKKHGLRYIHLPIGYDGISSNRVVELIQAARSASGPLYVHCHHGKHRGPAAAAIACLGTAGWTPNQAVAFLRQAGTSTEYAGLYQSVGQFQAPQLSPHSTPELLPEVATTSTLVDFMVAIDDRFERLKSAQKNQWKADPKHPGDSPAQQALLVWEQLRELLRSEDTKQRAPEYRQSLEHAEWLAQAFHGIVRSEGSTTADMDEWFQRLSRSCNECHKAHRN